MAYTNLVPISFSPTVTPGAAANFSLGKITSNGTTGINLSAWVSLTAKLIPPTSVPYGTDVAFGTVSGDSSGNLSLVQAAADLAGIVAGTGRFIVTGKPTSGDDAQLLCSGTITVLPA